MASFLLPFFFLKMFFNSEHCVTAEFFSRGQKLVLIQSRLWPDPWSDYLAGQLLGLDQGVNGTQHWAGGWGEVRRNRGEELL